MVDLLRKYVVDRYNLQSSSHQVKAERKDHKEGKRHDPCACMLTESGFLQDLQRCAISPTGHLMCLYGDSAYPLRVNLQGPFKYAILTPQMQEFNAAMSAVRISVEWLFGDIINYFKFIDFKKNLKIGLRSVIKMYVVCAILRNALTCLQPYFCIFWSTPSANVIKATL